MIITGKAPRTWRQLQDQVGKILRDCGFLVEIEKTLKVDSGKKKIDVYAEERVQGRLYTIICECKYWKAKIPQEIVHGFQWVNAMSDSNKAYIISTSSFQKGAYQAIGATNLKLITWPEFQEEYFETWYTNFFYHEISKASSVSTDYNFLPYFDDLSEVDRQLYFQTRNRLRDIELILSHFPSPLIKSIQGREIVFGQLPLRGNLFIGKEDYWDLSTEIPDELLDASYCDEFLQEFISFCKSPLETYNYLEAKYGPRDHDY